MRLMRLNPGVTALAAFCVTSQAYAPPLNIATGPNPNVDGYLRVGPDEYGSWNSATFAGLGDIYNPAGPDAGGLGPTEVGFSNGFMIFTAGVRELLSDNASWQAVICSAGSIGSDAGLTRMVTSANVPSDTDANGVNDTLTSSFRVFGASTDLLVDVEQEVDAVTGNSVAFLTQRYTITNASNLSATFQLLRIGDFDLLYNGTAFGDDSVGTDRALANNRVFQQEAGTPATRVTLVSVEATDYTGGIRGITPTGGPPAYGFGTDCQEWDNPGLPATWADHIAAVGTKTNGESGAQPAGCTLPDCDGHIDLNIPVVDLATDESVTITVRYLFGETCEWDCDPLPDGQVGITDFLKLLADWDAPSPCDFDGGGVGIVDFLKLLANWGPCLPAQLTNCCLPIDLDAYCQDPSTDPPEACVQLTCADCEAQGGLCVEECNLVEQTITVVNESAPKGGERHSTWTALVCAPKSACVCGNLVDALFTPATSCAGGQGTFIDFQSTPIPADFFGPGSDPFFELACLKGVPLGPTLFGEYGIADTLILRAADPFDCAAPPGGPVQIEVEIVELSLRSISPVTVTFNGGQDPEEWDLDIDLSVLPQQPGGLNATKTHSNGGTFDSLLPVLPRLTFTQVGNPGNIHVLDFGQAGFPPIQLSSEGPTDWVHEVKLGTLKPEGPPSCFNPGISEDNP